MFKLVKRVFPLLLITLTFYAMPASAQVSLTGGTGLFFVQKAEPIGDMAFAVGLFYDESNYDYLGTQWDAKTWYPPVALGIGSAFELSVATPWRQQVPQNEPDPNGMWDGLARAKYNFYNNQDNGVSISGIFMLTLPLGDKDKDLGAGQSNPGIAIAIDKKYESLTLSVNAGYLFHGEEESNDQLLYGIGIEYAATADLGLIAEYSGFSYTGSDSAKDDNVMTMLGARYYLNDNVSLQAGYGFGGGGDGAYSPNRYFMAGATLTFGHTRNSGGGASAGKTSASSRAGSVGDVREGIDIKEETPAKVVTAPPAVPAVVATDAPVAHSKPKVAPVRFSLSGINFNFDKSTLTEKAISIMRANVDRINESQSAHLLVEGHTCSIGREAYNMKLGLRRALSAQKFLVTELGIDPNRVSVKSYGETKPIESNNTDEGRIKNRRVDFVIIDK